ncbi:MAG: 4-hydroxy-3-methylbut-2-enyl diphosphate reductase [Limnochordia bacterium]
MEVIRVTPRGYCYGVVDAIKKAKDAALNPDIPRPIYILGLIVHNRHVVDELREEHGIISLDGADRLSLLKQIDRGTVIFTAHGVSPRIKQEAEARGLMCIDATCPDVTRTHDLVRQLVERGYHIIYVGKRGHPESEGIVGEAPNHVHPIENMGDVDALQLPSAPLAVTTQTTLSQWDTKDLIDYIRCRYPDIEVYNEICLATQERQVAAVEAAAGADVVIVVGDSRSNNSNRLVQVVQERAGKPAYLVDSARDLRPEWFIGAKRVAVTAGSSTPTALTREVIEALERWPTAQPAVDTTDLARSHYENFTVLSWLLPRRLRRDVSNLYAYCRTVDDLGDEAPGDRLALLAEFEADLRRCFSGTPEQPLLVALQQTILRHDLPEKPFLDLIAANRQDQEKARYATWEELLDYCTYSANPVGRLYLQIIGFTDAKRQELSDAICTALQLVNFWQDISVDAEMGRLYIPQEALRKAGVSEEEVLEGRDSVSSGALVSDLCAYTREFFERGSALLSMLPWPHCYNVRLFVLGGMSALAAVEADRDTALSKRPVLSRSHKRALALRALLPRFLGGV